MRFGLAEQRDHQEEQGIDEVGDRDRRDPGREGLAEQELPPDRRGEDGLEGPLLVLAGDRRRRDDGRHEDRDAQQVEQDMLVREALRGLRRQAEHDHQRLDDEDEGRTAIAKSSERLCSISRSSLRMIALHASQVEAQPAPGPEASSTSWR